MRYKEVSNSIREKRRVHSAQRDKPVHLFPFSAFLAEKGGFSVDILSFSGRPSYLS